MAMLPPESDKPMRPEWPPSLAPRWWWPWLSRGSNACLAWERACARWLHQATVWPWLLLLMQGVSRLSDGLIWYLTFPALWWWGGPNGLPCMLPLVCMSGVNLVIYKALKQGTGRPRPFRACPGIRVCARTLDEYSFPSGHTLHAVAFTAMLSTYYPALSWPLGLFTGLVALSRIVLGLHYPSDVLVGALIGATSAWATLHLF